MSHSLIASSSLPSLSAPSSVWQLCWMTNQSVGSINCRSVFDQFEWSRSMVDECLTVNISLLWLMGRLALIVFQQRCNISRSWWLHLSPYLIWNFKSCSCVFSDRITRLTQLWFICSICRSLFTYSAYYLQVLKLFAVISWMPFLSTVIAAAV